MAKNLTFQDPSSLKFHNRTDILYVYQTSIYRSQDDLALLKPSSSIFGTKPLKATVSTEILNKLVCFITCFDEFCIYETTKKFHETFLVLFSYEVESFDSDKNLYISGLVNFQSLRALRQ